MSLCDQKSPVSAEICLGGGYTDFFTVSCIRLDPVSVLPVLLVPVFCCHWLLFGSLSLDLRRCLLCSMFIVLAGLPYGKF